MPLSEEPILDEAKQEQLDIVRALIENMIDYGGEEGFFIEETLSGIDLEEIHEYMTQLQINQDLPFRLPLIRFSKIEDSKTFLLLCEHMRVHNIPRPPIQRIYFIETADFAITFIPIEFPVGKPPLENAAKVVNILVQPLEHSPAFIKDLYKEEKEGDPLKMLERLRKIMKV